jgi:hypothetical protein
MGTKRSRKGKEILTFRIVDGVAHIARDGKLGDPYYDILVPEGYVVSMSIKDGNVVITKPEKV